jgi:cytochrome c5
MKLQSCLAIVLALAFSEPVFANEKELVGVQTYKAVCAVCHTSGVANAPKFGDKNAWKPLIDEGQVHFDCPWLCRRQSNAAKGRKTRLIH